MEMHEFYMNTNKFYMNTNKLCMNTYESWYKISGFAVDIWVKVSEIGIFFVAVSEGPIILLKICEIHLQVSSLHTL